MKLDELPFRSSLHMHVRATDCPRPKSYDTGVDVEVGRSPSGDLMIVQGPLLIDVRNSYFETGAVESFALPSPSRLDNWMRANVHVKGRAEWQFVKLHTHGMQSRDAWFGSTFRRCFEEMCKRWTSPPFRLHFVSAREMYNIVKAAEAGKKGNPDQYRDFDVPRPANRIIRCSRPWRLLSHSEQTTELEVLEHGHKLVEMTIGSLRVRGDVRHLLVGMRNGQVRDVVATGPGSFDISYCETEHRNSK